jgi:hypothetical protein
MIYILVSQTNAQIRKQRPNGQAYWSLQHKPPESLEIALALSKTNPHSYRVVERGEDSAIPKEWGFGTYSYATGKPVLVASRWDTSG